MLFKLKFLFFSSLYPLVPSNPRDNAVEEGGDTEEEIEHFTLVLKDTAQPSSQVQARAPDRLDHLIGRVEELHIMLASHINHYKTQFTYLQG